MLVAIVAEKQIASISKAIDEMPDAIDIIELRLDYLENINLSDIKVQVSQSRKPIIFTLRAINNSGYFSGSEELRLNLLMNLANLQPAYIDIESDVSSDFIENLANLHPEINIIRSYHNFSCTPDDLESVLTAMQHKRVRFYKLITTANSSLDSLRILNFVQQHHQHQRHNKLIAHCMGELGTTSRILGAVVGNYFTYTVASPHHSFSAIGCLTLDELMNIYNYKNLNTSTKIFALIGDPVSHSVGHIFHNKRFRENNFNGVYVKLRVTSAELPLFFYLSKTLPFTGLSVTMPLKQDVVPFVQQFDDDSSIIQALNTLFRKNTAWHGINTDGIGAIQAIREQANLESKNILILGAGGSAKAIAMACVKSGIKSLVIANRTLATALSLINDLRKLAPSSMSLSACEFDQEYPLNTDIVINTLSSSTDIDRVIVSRLSRLNMESLVILNIDYAHPDSVLNSYLVKYPLTLIKGLDMFKHQAVAQSKYWLSALHEF